jgi:hypothetical protein
VAKCSEKDWNGCEKIMFYALLFWVSFWLGNHVLVLSAVGGRLEGVLRKNKKKFTEHLLQNNFLGIRTHSTLNFAEVLTTLIPTGLLHQLLEENKRKNSKNLNTLSPFHFPIHRAFHFSFRFISV